MTTYITGDTGVSKVQDGVIVTADIGDAQITPAKLSQPLTLGTAQATTSGTAIDFTGIPSWAKRITVMLNGVSKSGSTNLLLQIGDSGGVETTGYTALCVFAGASAVGATITSTSGFPSAGDASGASITSGTFTLLNSNNNEWHCVTNLTAVGSYSSTGGGTKALSNTLDRIRLTTTGADTFDAGSVNILYEG